MADVIKMDLTLDEALPDGSSASSIGSEDDEDLEAAFHHVRQSDDSCPSAPTLCVVFHLSAVNGCRIPKYFSLVRVMEGEDLLYSMMDRKVLHHLLKVRIEIP